jgi:hypothetical protein
MAEATSKHLGLSSGDIAILCGRNYLTKANWSGSVFLVDRDFPPVFSRLNLAKSFRLIREFDDWFASICTEEFTFYTPHLGLRVFSLIANHPYCSSYSYIEEGLASYSLPLEPSNLRPWSVDYFWPWNRIRQRQFFEANYKNIFAANPKAFGDAKNKVVLSPRFRSNSYLFSSNDALSEGVVFILQPINVKRALEGCAYYQVLRDELEFFAETNKKIYFKLHPAQAISDEAAFVRTMMLKYSAVEIPQDICLETLSSDFKTCVLVTKNSSSVLYVDNCKDNVRLLSRKLIEYLPGMEAEFTSELEFIESIVRGDANSSVVVGAN